MVYEFNGQTFDSAMSASIAAMEYLVDNPQVISVKAEAVEYEAEWPAEDFMGEVVDRKRVVRATRVFMGAAAHAEWK